MHSAVVEKPGWRDGVWKEEDCVGSKRGLLRVTRALPAPQGWLWILEIIAIRRARCLEFEYLETVRGKAC